MCVKLSIVVPVYNKIDYLKQCIDSILTQSFEDIELILIDDGSTDGSADVCDEYARIDRRVKVYHRENSGPMHSRKFGVEKAVGDYVTFVDADDFVAESSFALALEDMGKGIDVISFDIMRYFGEDWIRTDIDLYTEGLYSKEELAKEIYPSMIWDAEQNSYGLDPALWNKIYKKSLLRDQFSTDVCEKRFHYGEDAAIVYPLMMDADTLSIHHEAYYYHRQRGMGCLPPYIADEQYFDKLYILYKYLIKTFAGQEIFRKQIDLFYMESVKLKGMQYGKERHHHYRLDQVFPFDKVSKGERIVLYGAGNLGRLYRAQLMAVNYCDIVLWADKNYEKYEEIVKAPSEIGQESYDKVVIAIEDEKIREVVKDNLVEMGVPTEQII